MTGTPAGPIVDGLQITFESIESDHLVAERLGMLRAAERMSLPDSSQWEDG